MVQHLVGVLYSFRSRYGIPTKQKRFYCTVLTYCSWLCLAAAAADDEMQYEHSVVLVCLV